MVNFAEFKKFFLFNLIGSLIISALVAVVTVLIGDFNEVTLRVLLTLLMVVVHSIISLGFIYDNERQHTFERLTFFINVLFVLIVLSFVTSLFGIWKIVDGTMVFHLYQTYFVLAFAALHADVLSKALNKEKYLDIIVFINYIFMTVVVLMLLPIIYTNASLGDMYYRILGAAGIVDGTLSILAIIFYKIHMQNHPEAVSPLVYEIQGQQTNQEQPKKKSMSPWVWVLMAFLLIQVILPIIFFAMSSLFR